MVSVHGHCDCAGNAKLTNKPFASLQMARPLCGVELTVHIAQTDGFKNSLAHRNSLSV
jgi:hypothetical protein